VLGKLDTHMQRVKLDNYLLPQKKSLKCETQNYRTTRGKLLYIGLGNEFLGLTPKAQATKAKIDKWDCIQIKSFCIAKEKNNNMKRQLAKMVKYL
jgi:GH24 family phage-related lysozyme (muramidase)